MSLSDYLILAAVGVWFISALLFLLHPKKKNGCGSCHGYCSGCRHCTPNDKKEKNERGFHE